jgi:hypothetical protein
MAIKGSKSVLIDCMDWPSYAAAVCILYKHADMSKTDRIARAFDGMDLLTGGKPRQ